MNCSELFLIERNGEPDYVYVIDCVSSSNGEAINDMADRAREISFRTLVHHVGRPALQQIFPFYDWSRRPLDLTLERDYAVRYYRSVWLGVPVVYVMHSAIEYIFVRRDMLPKLRGKTL